KPSFRESRLKSKPQSKNIDRVRIACHRRCESGKRYESRGDSQMSQDRVRRNIFRVFGMSCGMALAILTSAPASAAELPLVTKVEQQPLVSATERLLEALEIVGAPLPAAETEALKAALKEEDASKALKSIQKILDPHCLVMVTINAESRVSVVE